jgi:hypothetical protein
MSLRETLLDVFSPTIAPATANRVESKHHVVCLQTVASRSIEQHAHIPYTHGSLIAATI